MSFDQRPTKVKVYAGQQSGAIAGTGPEPTDGPATGGASNAPQVFEAGDGIERHGGMYALLWGMIGALLFLVGSLIGGVFLLFWLVRQGFFS